MSRPALLVSIWLLVGSVSAVQAAELDLRRAVLVTSPNLSKSESKAVTMLLDEVQKRTLVRWETAQAWPADGTSVVAVGPAASLQAFAGPFADRLAARRQDKGAEGYQILVETKGRAAPAVFVVGNDARGVLFGVGRLLRELHLARGKLTLADDVDVATAPKYPLRGHQLGYRPKTN